MIFIKEPHKAIAAHRETFSHIHLIACRPELNNTTMVENPLRPGELFTTKKDPVKHRVLGSYAFRKTGFAPGTRSHHPIPTSRLTVLGTRSR